MRYLKTTYRFLSENKLYTSINVFGLSISLMFVITISNFIIKEYFFDDFHANVDEIYALGDQENASSAYRVGALLQERYPEIKQTCGIVDLSTVGVIAGNNKFHGNLLAADATFFNLFSFNLVSGEKNHVLLSENNIVISEHLAEKIYGTELECVGKFLKIADSLTYCISGVFSDFENTVLPNTDIIINIDNMTHFNKLVLSHDLENAGTTLFIQANDGIREV